MWVARLHGTEKLGYTANKETDNIIKKETDDILFPPSNLPKDLSQTKEFFSSPIKLNSSNSRAFFRSFFPLLRLTKVEFSKTKQDKHKTKIIKNGYKLYARRVQIEKNITFF